MWAVLSENNPVQPTAIVDALGVGRSTVYKALNRLQWWGLAQGRDDDGGWSSVDADLDQIAEEITFTAGSRTLKKQTHQEERRQWHAGLPLPAIERIQHEDGHVSLLLRLRND